MREHSLKRSTPRAPRRAPATRARTVATVDRTARGRHAKPMPAEPIDLQRVARIRRALGDPSHVERLSRTFRALGDPTRSKLVFALSLEELCVTELAEALGASLSATSHQLRILPALDIVRVRRDGKSEGYALTEQAFGFCSPRSCHAWRQIDARSLIGIDRRNARRGRSRGD